MGRLIRAWAAALIALPYRARFKCVGRRPRMFPPLLLRGTKRMSFGDDVRIQSLAFLSAGAEGSVTIGSRCEIGSFARVDADEGTIIIGDGSSVNSFCLLNGYGGLRIGSGVRIASHSVVLSSSHRHGDAGTPIHDQGIVRQETVIEDDVWLGSHCVVVAGVTIGAHSVVGAGAVVVDDIPPYSVAVGVPARVVRSRQP